MSKKFSATHIDRTTGFRLVKSEFSTKLAACKHAASLTDIAQVRVETPAGNLVTYFSHGLPTSREVAALLAK